MPSSNHPPVVLFGYDSSPFTNKVRLALRLKGVPFSYVAVPSMMPRPLLAKTFAVSYRKIPILAIGREVYCDTSLIIEALEHYFPSSQGWGTVYPKCEGVGDWAYRGMARGFASFWTDKPFFRTTTGLIPVSVWSSEFGRDRGQLIGHSLDPKKLGEKIPQNLSNLDLHLSLIEPTFRNGTNTWAFPTKKPSLADISLYYQLRWAIDIAAGKGIYNLTGGGTQDTSENVTDKVFNQERYPGLWKWFHALESYINGLPDLETVVDGESTSQWKDAVRQSAFWSDDEIIVPSAADQHPTLDAQRGLVPGVTVSVAPDDTGRNNPTVGKLVKMGVEEVVITPVGSEEAEIDCRIHFPRLGFVVKVLDGSRL